MEIQRKFKQATEVVFSGIDGGGLVEDDDGRAGDKFFLSFVFTFLKPHPSPYLVSLLFFRMLRATCCTGDAQYSPINGNAAALDQGRI